MVLKWLLHVTLHDVTSGCLLPQQRKLGTVAHAQEVVSIDGPGHHTCQPLVEGVVRLDSDGPLVVKTDPAVTTARQQAIIISTDGSGLSLPAPELSSS